MFTPRMPLAGVASLLLALVAGAQDLAPQRLDATLFYQLQSQVVFSGPTLVVLVPLPAEDGPLDNTPGMAERRASVTQVVDAAAAVAEVVAPLRRPRLQRGYLPGADLQDLQSDYQTPGRPVAL